jgi:hypothetical protein
VLNGRIEELKKNIDEKYLEKPIFNQSNTAERTQPRNVENGVYKSNEIFLYYRIRIDFIIK